MSQSTFILGSAVAYAIVLIVEITGLRRRLSWHRSLLALLMLVALFSHWFALGRSGTARSGLPISTADWLLWAAWLLGLIYFAVVFYLPRTPTGIVLLPIVLGLLLSSNWASTTPLASEQSLYAWGALHGVLLLAGTVAVCIGFLAGLMYLLQSYALKHARSPVNGLRLPSLEWLERVNSRTLGVSTVLIALGFITGIVMSIVIHRGESAYVLWADPVVISLAAMLAWLVAAEAFRLIYPAARQGRKVAYLTLASFVFLVIALASFTLLDNVHGPKNARKTHASDSSEHSFPLLSSLGSVRKN
jgi:ABC-type uncharacterized transport system permease subunit